MKIRIIGISGSGKSYLAGKLNEKLNIPHFDLDDFFWDNEQSAYNTKRPIEDRTKLYNDAISLEDWIVEGVYYKWTNESFEKADIIILLKTPFKICRWRILKRFFRRKFRIEKPKNETLKSVMSLIDWVDDFYRDEMPIVEGILNSYKNKLVILKNAKEVNKYIENFK